ncbi:MAG: type II secretion system F family protein [Pseudomonas marincola]
MVTISGVSHVALLQMLFGITAFLGGGCILSINLWRGYQFRTKITLRLRELTPANSLMEKRERDLIDAPVKAISILKQPMTYEILGGVIGVLSIIWIVASKGSLLSLTVFGGEVSVIAFVYFARQYLRSLKLEKLSTQFPETLDMIARNARVGVTLEESFQHIQSELPKPISSLFGEISSNLSIGIPLVESLEKIAVKLDLREIRYLSAILSVQRKSGGKYAEIIGKLSQNIRDQHEQKKRINAVTAEARTAAKVVTIIAGVAALSMVFINPGQFEFLLTDQSGQMLLMYCTGSILVGFLIIFRMLSSLND